MKFWRILANDEQAAPEIVYEPILDELRDTGASLPDQGVIAEIIRDKAQAKARRRGAS